MMCFRGFNPRPPISQRATLAYDTTRPPGKEFQSTPANFTAGDAVAADGSRADDLVSIHARQFHSGRLSASASSSARLSAFQSTPANFTAGDRRRWPSWRWRPARFNPRPPISQRATRAHPPLRDAGDVSIHARQFHSGRPMPSCDTSTSMAFQSTPANFTAGDGTRYFTIWRDQIGFNPRPPISQRATLLLSSEVRAPLVFQSTPANFTAGDCAALAASMLPASVSIHARQFHSGRLFQPSR